MWVKNAGGTSDKACKCGSWLEHWKKFSGQAVPGFCPANDCYEKELVGAHVKKHDWSDTSTYIVPLCNKHNSKDSASEISDAWGLVSANVAATCGK